ncbi:hypothetical protein TorRG33x02_251300, partial [Trema orientale]
LTIDDLPTHSHSGPTAAAVVELPESALTLTSKGAHVMKIRQGPDKEPTAGDDKVIDLAELHARQLHQEKILGTV